jgi:hypothetical protein
MTTGAYDDTDFRIYEREGRVAIEANSDRAADFLRSSMHKMHDGKLVLLNDADAYYAFDAIDAVGMSTMTY